MDSTESSPSPDSVDKASLSVTLTAYDWHALLREMEEMSNIVNRDQRNLRILYTAIASQLAGEQVNPFARIEEREAAEAKRKAYEQVQPSSSSVSTPRERPSWWCRIWNAQS